MSKTAKEFFKRHLLGNDPQWMTKPAIEEYGELCREEEREKIKSIREIGLEQPEITSIEDAIEDIERCSKEALEPYYESQKNKREASAC